jgi:hypothetical protein
MAGFNQNLLNEFAGIFGSGKPYLRDYNHASKIFRTNNYQRSPKLKIGFHVYFEPTQPVDGENYGLLVKEVKLPTFGFATVHLNQYNRKRIVQTKIKYEPIEITFHDDNESQSTKLWEKYYTYYYNDANKPGSVLLGARGGAAGAGPDDYNRRNIYSGENINGSSDWGYSGGQSNSDGSKAPFFKNITIFGLSSPQRQFIAYTLINPIITSFSHDTYSHSDTSGTMTNRMSLDYETVVYNYGSYDGESPENIITGFGNIATYDKEPSPIANLGSNRYTQGKGGLVDAAGGFVDSPNAGNPAGAIIAAGDAYNSFANPNLKVAVPKMLASMATTAFQNTPVNRNTNFSFATAAATPGPAGLANSPPIGALTMPPNPAFTTPNAGEQYTGPTVGFVGVPPFNPNV